MFIFAVDEPRITRDRRKGSKVLKRMVEGSRGYLGRECRGDLLDRWIEMLMELNA